MEATPRMRSAFPMTPARSPDSRARRFEQQSSSSSSKQPLPQIPTLSAAPSTASTDPLIPENYIDAPSQRLYAVALWTAIWAWHIYDFSRLQEEDEQSLWLCLKFLFVDGLFLYGLPSLRIPWLSWSTGTMTLIFLGHALIDFMFAFRVSIPIGAGLTVLARSVWGAYEIALNERNVNRESIVFNDTLILGRQVVNILPEGSAILNPKRDSFCLDATRTEIRLPIVINATNPIGMEILRIDLETQANETLSISKSQIKQMHKDASRLLSYSEDINEPKTLFFPVKKPGLYVLAKVVDESNLEVSRKKLAHTVVVPCPKAAILPSPSDMCSGELSNVELLVTGTPPMKVKYRKMVNQATQDATFESIQPEDLVSPLIKQDHGALAIPNRVDVSWAKTRDVRVPLSESLTTPGKWVYAIDEVTDGFGNSIRYSDRDQDSQSKHPTKAAHLHQVITVHNRPSVHMQGCSAQHPLKVAKGRVADLPLQYRISHDGELSSAAHHIEYLFSPQDSMPGTGEHAAAPSQKKVSLKDPKQALQIKEPGLYTITGISTDFCAGEVLEPASCSLLNPPEPDFAMSNEPMFDKCAGNPIGLRVDLDLVGTPPFEIKVRTHKRGVNHHRMETYKASGLRYQMSFEPNVDGHWTYEFVEISDAVYKKVPIKGKVLSQDVKPAASAKFASRDLLETCIDEKAHFDLTLFGEAPFTVEWELVHGGRRLRNTQNNITSRLTSLETVPLTSGGDYTLALVSVTDGMGCKEFLDDEAKISVRQQKPKVGFGLINGHRTAQTLEGQAVELPLRISAGERPWTVKYTDTNGIEKTIRASDPNDNVLVEAEGTYELTGLSDSLCPGVVDEAARKFEVSWVARPEWRIAPQDIKEKQGSTIIKNDVCEGDEDAIELLFKGAPPYQMSYVQTVKLDHGVAAPKTQDIRAAINVAPMRMDTSQAGTYDYKFIKLGDVNYDHSSKHFTPASVRQRVHARPTAAFADPGRTYGFCSVESEGEEVIPVTLHGQPPFELEVEIKHFGSVRPELVTYHDIITNTHNIRIPHSRLHLGKSAVSLRRVSDSRGCSRSLDSSAPRVQISVHDAPAITPLETSEDFCVGDRINFGLSGVAPFNVFYTFDGAARKAAVSSGNTFRRLAEKPGVFVVTGLQDSASNCRAATQLTKRIHGMPSVRVSKGKDAYIDIHEGSEAEILFEFGGVPPFEFTYIRTSNTEKGGKKGVVLDMKTAVSEDYSMKIAASEGGTYEVVAIKDAHCAYTKPGVRVPDKKERNKRLTY
ncbi:uncharacterized protein K489DRAFT_377673 [Dissoconium aciculare CBS 342.82]|uniref:Nucleoporin Pom152 n=1 Tax=Dissoconium aciculare CBS 342.82 TaxID=1314786 RepID=A0A6J3MBZ9_9PEZI|nr:uncharacterized protein K489DRAFT_377673 [Dissoconium aciculare CBS 342.82]KAF1825129.1 hypothetical protein K489DRAFT_377673 [Dissoconium aciculare CBS 342.82]